MPVTQVHRGLGDFELNLVGSGTAPATPCAILDLITPFSAIVITPTWMGPAGTVGSAGLLAAASWSGIVLGRANSRRTWTGHSPAVLLGDPDGKGKLFYSTTSPTRTIANYVTNEIIGGGHGNGITAGTITSSATTYTVRIKAGSTPRQLLDYLCDRATVEWRINPDFTLDINAKATLFPTATTPTLIVRRDTGGRDFNLTGWSTNVDVSTDWEDYTTHVEVEPTSGSNGTADISPATGYYAPDGTRVEMDRYITSTKATSTSAANGIASAQLARFTQPRHEIKLDPLVYDLGRDVHVGDTIWVEDIPNGLYDPANEVMYRGQVCHPTTARVMAATWKIQQGMGVYLRGSDSSNTITDLTPYVEWESGPVEVEVNAVRRTTRVF